MIISDSVWPAAFRTYTGDVQLDSSATGPIVAPLRLETVVRPETCKDNYLCMPGSGKNARMLGLPLGSKIQSLQWNEVPEV